MSDFTLYQLEKIIAERADSADGESYTRTLLDEGVAKCAEKLGEETIETIVAAMAGDRVHLKQEIADLLFHLLVLMRANEISLQDVDAVLAGRTGQSGLAEKAARQTGDSDA
jgi:phosphoribosyl-ATP pyrophosphohydrolase